MTCIISLLPRQYSSQDVCVKRMICSPFALPFAIVKSAGRFTYFEIPCCQAPRAFR